MVFNSLQFILFFILVVALYFALPHRVRWILLLLASYYFYMSWKVEYGLLLLATTFLDYCIALLIERTHGLGWRKVLLSISLISNLGMLFLFKYWTFFSDSTRVIFEAFNISVHTSELRLLLPIGISFYVFQSLSYTIDVYRGQQKAERHFGIFALYVSFFPQLVAGPIERAAHLLPQFRHQHTFDYRRIVDGLKLAVWGLFKKMVIADRLAEFVNAVYNNPAEHGALAFIVATYAFAFQIYCDFSGYSDIAIGTANVMGYDFRDNFRRPYFSKSIAEFWRRWHISLSTWLKDYVYFPLGGNRHGVSRQYLNLFLTFLISGLWHGANWTFVLWGMLHGIYMVVGRITQHTRDAWYARREWQQRTVEYIRLVLTFNLICFAWIFFRANSFADLITIMRRSVSTIDVSGFFETAAKTQLWLALVWIGFLIGVELIQRTGEFRKLFAHKPVVIRWASYITIVLAILLFGKFGGHDFIYFQF